MCRAIDAVAANHLNWVPISNSEHFLRPLLEKQHCLRTTSLVFSTSTAPVQQCRLPNRSICWCVATSLLPQTCGGPSQKPNCLLHNGIFPRNLALFTGVPFFTWRSFASWSLSYDRLFAGSPQNVLLDCCSCYSSLLQHFLSSNFILSE